MMVLIAMVVMVVGSVVVVVLFEWWETFSAKIISFSVEFFPRFPENIGKLSGYCFPLVYCVISNF